jgi:hypothetical protein
MFSTLMIINCITLTTCDSIRNGEMVKLDFVDGDGRAISLRLAFEHAQSIAMTLPQLLTRAVRAQTGQDNARYVFPLGEWALEGVEGDKSVILTMKTEDGFEVSFRLPPRTCKSLGWVLQHEGDASARSERPDDAPAGSGNPEFH